MTKLSFFSVLGVSLLCSFAVEARVGQQEERRVTELQDLGGEPSNLPLSVCQGDCDNDDECEGDLICFHRENGEEIPGCDGDRLNKKSDFCIPVSQHPNPSVIGLPTMTIKGKNGNFDSFPLEECEGDCDSDSDCADGLVCFQGTPSESVPGCRGSDRSRNDYCVKAANAGIATTSFSKTFKMPTKIIQTIEWRSTAPNRSPSDAEYAGATKATELWLHDEGKRHYRKETSFRQTRVDVTLTESSRSEMRYKVETYFEANARADIPTNLMHLMAVQGVGFDLNNLKKELKKAQPEGSMYEEIKDLKQIPSPNGSTVEV